jgi:hypothetical protein
MASAPVPAEPAPVPAAKKVIKRKLMPTAEHEHALLLLRDQKDYAVKVVREISKMQKAKERVHKKMMKKGQDLTLEDLNQLRAMKTRALALGHADETTSAGHGDSPPDGGPPSTDRDPEQSGPGGNPPKGVQLHDAERQQLSGALAANAMEDLPMLDQVVAAPNPANATGSLPSGHDHEELAVNTEDGTGEKKATGFMQLIPRQAARLVNLSSTLAKDKD